MTLQYQLKTNQCYSKLDHFQILVVKSEIKHRMDGWWAATENASQKSVTKIKTPILKSKFLYMK